MHTDALGVDARQHRRDRRGDRGAGSEQLVADTHVVAFAPDRITGRHRPREPNGVVADPFGVLDHDHGVGTGRHRRSGHDPDRLTRPDRHGRSDTGGEFTDHTQFHRNVGDVVGPHGVAVDGGVVERWHVLGGNDCGGEHEADGRSAIDLDGAEWWTGLEHERLGVLQRGHTANVPHGL